MANMIKLVWGMVLLVLFFTVPTNSMAQDVVIDLQSFVLQVPEVTTLRVRPLGALVPRSNAQDSTRTDYLLPIYYELIRADGRAVESRNIEVPEQFWDLLVKYQKGTLTAQDRQVINVFLGVFNASMRLRE